MIIQLIRQYTVFMPNIPGALSHFIKLFADRGINIVGIASEVRDDSGVVRVTIDSKERIGYILTQTGFTSIETLVLSLESTDEPGFLYKVSKILGDAGINITTVYGTATTGESVKSRLMLTVSDPQKAEQMLKEAFEK
jgi:hypothetical protein